MSDETGHILVADDNRLNRLKLSRSLEQQGHTVTLAEDGKQALDLLREHPFDVVLLDIMMPVMDGYEVLSQLKSSAELRHIPVIVISALDELDSAVHCIEMGAEDYLAKPFNPVFLKARLGASLRRKNLRDLEQVYLQQEVMLRQSEKLATLGRLSAGMAHEINNPAAALRGIEQVGTAFDSHLEAHLALATSLPTAPQVEAQRQLVQTIRAGEERSDALDPLSRGDREAELEDWLDDRKVNEAWELTPALVTMGFDTEKLTALETTLGRSQLAAALAWLVSSFTIADVLAEVHQATERISEIAGALKAYSYLDQAPVQSVDVREGLDNTLMMLGSRLSQEISVERRYPDELPRIEAFGSELNQVWTNLIDNALTAMEGRGTLTLTVDCRPPWLVVEVGDSGPGIPEADQPRIFDPFFTTKPPGEGTGMGLNISHNIVVQKHHGEISVSSKLGDTHLCVKLPLEANLGDATGEIALE